MLDRDPKKMASGVLIRAFGGGMTPKSNFPNPSAGGQPSPSIFGSPGNKSNFPMPDQKSSQQFAEGGEVMSEGKMAAAEEAMSGLKDGDAKKFASALKSFFEQCYSEAEYAEEAAE